MAYEQPAAEQPQDSGGFDVKKLIRQYGPMAAVAAAIPAIVLARGAGGQKMMDIIRRYAPKHLETLQKSPMTYELIQDAGARGPAFTTTQSFGRTPPRGYIQSSPDTKMYPLDHVTMHEFGHAAGYERARQRFLNAAGSTPLHYFGGFHMDKLLDPKSQRIMANEYVKNPKSLEYALYRLDDQNVMGFGESLNDLWARRMLKRGGYRGPMFDPPGPARAKEVWGGTLDQMARTGAYPPDAELQLRNAIEAYVRNLNSLNANSARINW